MRNLIQPGVFWIMFLIFIKTSKPASLCQRIARQAFAHAVGQHVQTAKRLLETWSAYVAKPVMNIGGFDYANGQPGLKWRGMH